MATAKKTTTKGKATPATPATKPSTPKKATSPHPASTPTEVTVDKALKARWSEALERYRRARTDETEGWDARYEALGDILESDPPYYLAGGYKSAAAFLKAEVPDQDERTVRMYIRVARYFDPEDEARFGVAKLDLLLRYLEAAGGVPLAPAKVHPDRQKIKVPATKGMKTIALAEATAEDLRKAARAAANKGGKPAASVSPAVRTLRDVLGKAKLEAVAVRVRSGHVDLGGIPWGMLGALGKALSGSRLGDKPPTD